MEIREILALFTEVPPLDYEIIGTGHGDGDFRETVIARWAPGSLPPELGGRMVIKLADNSFTDPKRIAMWDQLSREYRKRGFSCPRFLRAAAGDYPLVEYKGRSCVVHGESYASCATADRFPAEKISPEGKYTYLDDLLRMNAVIASARLDFTDLPSAWCLFRTFDPTDAEDEVMENARAWLSCAKNMPQSFQPRVERIWQRWLANRAFLEKEYHRLPTSVFQADLNSTNVLLGENRQFAGILDFNLAGREVFLNYLFREVPYVFGRGLLPGEEAAPPSPQDWALRRILCALTVVKEHYAFCEAEKDLALPLFRCLSPLWFTAVEQLKAAKGEGEIRAALDDAERALTLEIDFRSRMD